MTSHPQPPREDEEAQGELREWEVPYRLVTRGKAWVEARSAEEAEAIVEGGGFEADPNEEWSDWEVTGDAKEVK